MGDLDSELTELDSINLFYSSIEGLADIEPHPSFKRLNYKELFFLKFHVPTLENGVEIMKDVSPDCILWNEDKKLALIIEIKGRTSIDQTDIDQLNKYKDISLEQIQNCLRDAYDNPYIEIKQIFIGIVYYETTIERCMTSKICLERLNLIRNEYFVLKQNPGKTLKVLDPESLTFDPLLKEILEAGILLPRNPPRNILLTKDPCLKGVIWGIVNHIHDKFFKGEYINEINIEPLDLKRNFFSYSSVKLKRLISALEILTELNICTREENNYIFRYDTFDNFQDIFEKIKNIDCEQKNMHKGLDRFT